MLTLSMLQLACANREADPFRPSDTKAPGVYDIGELEVIGEDVLSQGLDGDGTAEAPGFRSKLYFGQLGAPDDPGTFGGATFQFESTGGPVCLVMDPEALYWSRALSIDAGGRSYKYTDHYEDDSDLDMSAGLTAYYTGSPGVEMGSFEAVYTDAQSVDHVLEFNECVQAGPQTDSVHSGRGTVEHCELDTSLHPGVKYTVVLDTFALPHDDSIANFGVAAFGVPCDRIEISECTIPDEVHAVNDVEGMVPTEGKAWFPELESVFCEGPGKVNDYCELHALDDDAPCVEPPPSDDVSEEEEEE